MSSTSPLLCQECIKKEEEERTAHPWLWSGRKCSFVPKYSRLQTNCKVFKWVPSITALTTDGWVANLELIYHTHELLAVWYQCSQQASL